MDNSVLLKRQTTSTALLCIRNKRSSLRSHLFCKPSFQRVFADPNREFIFKGNPKSQRVYTVLNFEKKKHFCQRPIPVHVSYAALGDSQQFSRLGPWARFLAIPDRCADLPGPSHEPFKTIVETTTATHSRLKRLKIEGKEQTRVRDMRHKANVCSSFAISLPVKGSKSHQAQKQ